MGSWKQSLQQVILDGLLFFCWTALLLWLHGTLLLSRFLSYVEGLVLSPVHSGGWVATGMTGSGRRSTTRSSRLHAGHREYRNQDLTSCKRMPARGRVSSCWQCLQRKTRCFIRLSSHRDYEMDMCRVSRQPAAIRPQAGDLDVDTSKMTLFLLLQDLDCCLPG